LGKGREDMKNQSQKTNSNKLMVEDLERWRNESPAAGQLSKVKGKAKQKTTPPISESEKTKAIPAKPNSGTTYSPDIKAQGWSAEELAEQSAYDDESQVKGQIKAGKKVSSHQ
jgi:hypothetical protein